MTSVACVLLEQLLALLARFQPALHPLCRAVKREILGAIFVGGVPGETSTPAAASPPPPDLPSFPTQQDAEDALCSATDSYMYSKTYYTLVRDVASKIGQAEEEIHEAEKRREKQSAVLDRGIRFWQLEVQKLILKGWKNHQAFRKQELELRQEIEAAAVENELLRKQIDVGEKEAAGARHQHRKEVGELTERLETQSRRLKALEEHLRNTDQERKQAKDTYSTAVVKVTQLKDTVFKLEQFVDKYNQILANVRKRCLQGGAWEIAKQNDFEGCDLVDETKGRITLAKLTEWVNRATELGEGSSTYRIDRVTDVEALLDNYSCILHYMSPGTIGEKLMRSTLSEVDRHKKACMVLEQAGRLGLVFPFTADDLIMPQKTSGPLHLFLVTTLLHRMADPTLAAVCGLPPLSGGGLETGLEEPQPKTPDQWAEVIDQVWNMNAKWRGIGALSLGAGVDILLDHVTDRAGAFDSGKLNSFEKDQLPRITEAPLLHPAVQKLLPDDPGEREVQANKMQGVLCANFKSLLKVFQFYASNNSRAKDVEIGPDELMKLVVDAKLKGVTKEKVISVFKKSNDAPSGGTQGETLSTEEYAVMLINLASESRGGEDLPQKFESLVKNNIVLHCQWTDTAEFRSQLYHREVQEVLKVHRELASQVFQYYAKGKTMKMEGFVELVNDMHIVDSVLTHEAVRQIFLKMQQDTGTDSLLDFQEFLFCLCAVAAFKNPAPYLPLFRRVSRFFTLWFVPAFNTPTFKRKLY